MRHPVRDQEGRVFREVAVVEDEQELAAVDLALKTLDRVRHARREVPQVALPYIVDEGPALLVDGGDAALPAEHVGPLGFLVPMHLAHDVGAQPHVDARHGGRDRQLAHGGLPRPAAVLDAHVAVGERPLQVGHGAAVGRRRAQGEGLLALSGGVAGTDDVGALAVADR